MSVSLPDYNAPAGWTDLLAVPAYAAAVSVGVRIVSKGSVGAVWWGGATAPTGTAGENIPQHYGASGSAANIWLLGSCTYSITVE